MSEADPGSRFPWSSRADGSYTCKRLKCNSSLSQLVLPEAWKSAPVASCRPDALTPCSVSPSVAVLHTGLNHGQSIQQRPLRLFWAWNRLFGISLLWKTERETCFFSWQVTLRQQKWSTDNYEINAFLNKQIKKPRTDLPHFSMLKYCQFWLNTDGPRWLWFDFWLCSKVQHCSKSWKGSPLLQNPAYVLLHAQERGQNSCGCPGNLPLQTIVCFGCAKCLQKLGLRSSEADAELLGAQRIWAQTQPQGLTGNQENVMALLHKSRLSPPGGGKRTAGQIFCSYFSWDLLLSMLVHMHAQRWDLEL